ncbi:MAG: hypothetical protein WC045_00120 [Patescibacteria group bacterium]
MTPNKQDPVPERLGKREVWKQVIQPFKEDPENMRGRIDCGYLLEECVVEQLRGATRQGSKLPMFHEVVRHDPNSFEDRQGKDITLTWFDEDGLKMKTSIGITMNKSSFKRFQKKHPGVQIFHFPIEVSFETMEREILEYCCQESLRYRQVIKMISGKENADICYIEDAEPKKIREFILDKTPLVVFKCTTGLMYRARLVEMLSVMPTGMALVYLGRKDSEINFLDWESCLRAFFVVDQE